MFQQKVTDMSKGIYQVLFNAPSSRIRLLILLIMLSVFSSGCSMIKSWLPEETDKTKSWSASKLYAEAKANLADGEYKTAIELYETLEARYPHGAYAQQAQLETAYAYYKFDEPESAIAAADRFIKLHPRHANVDYAYYLRGLITFPARKSVFEFLFPQDESKRDPNSSLESFNYFSELSSKFPNSKYAADAILRMRYLRNKVAKHELHVANYYMRRGAYIAAVDRASYVVEHYQRTPAVSEALLLMVKAYTELDQPRLAQDTQRVYNANAHKFHEQVFYEEEGVIPGIPDWMKPSE
ncbi:outer membrane protein assembly factor BamD [sulfur-oxidizing endosymbiont of Gigantopelta aegis]|uniref:outer membrane protein assembly factor BamD n=1 Tax=sulfur-oxidizing endosymbiont of Gigantopelta aegis TaxID=2794934 RepID=UPI001FE8855D|nr:outer membrane protein assembly factor BamD [sulfur-oxidizing endosymbiont of Gigantopelta aegis]